MIYLDSSALMKLVVAESESRALRTWLDQAREPLVSSALAKIEVTRGVRVHGPDESPTSQKLLRAARDVLGSLYVIPMSVTVVDSAAALPQWRLRSLDAIHLASALELGPELGSFVCYDLRLSDAATDSGLRVVAPS